jgi:hypothetical protein
LACLGLLCGLVLCSSAVAEVPGLREVEAFDAFPVYQAGEEVAGLRLEAVSSHPPVRGDDQRSMFWTFSYGDCDPPRDGDCDPQLQVQSWSTCYRWASQLHRRLRLFNVRGAKGIRGAGGSKVEVFTGRTTVVLFAYTRSFATAAARQMRKVSQTQTPSLLPAPVPGSLGGKLPCQRPW